MPSETFERLNPEKKQRILLAAQQEFTERIYEEAKVVHICKNADIPRITFYSYFNSLADIYSYLYSYLSKKYLEGTIMDCQIGSYDREWEEYNMKLMDSDQGLRVLYESIQATPIEQRILFHTTMSLSRYYRQNTISRSEVLSEFTQMRSFLLGKK